MTFSYAYDLNATDKRRGDVTIMSAIGGQSAEAIERRLGYHRGRLSDGYCVLQVLEPVRTADIIWSDRTRYSGGADQVGVELSTPGQIQWFDVPRLDIVRGNKLVRHGNDDIVDRELDELLNQSLIRLNRAQAKGELVKVIPNIAHNEDMPRHLQYPNAEAGNVPQWTLKVAKEMKCIARVAPGEVYAPGA